MAAYNSSTAYDSDLFQKRPEKKTDIAKLKVVKNRKPLPSSVFNPGVISSFLIVVILIILMVYNHVQLTELTGEINSLTSQLQTLDSENVRLTSALESSMKNETIAELAKAMGMQKRDEFQTELIYLYHEDKIERTELASKSGVQETARLTISSFLGRFKEYLGSK